MNFEFKVNPSICEFEGDAEQLYKAFKTSEDTYIVQWETKNGKSEVEYASWEVFGAISDGDWIIQY